MHTPWPSEAVLCEQGDNTVELDSSTNGFPVERVLVSLSVLNFVVVVLMYLSTVLIFFM